VDSLADGCDPVAGQGGQGSNCRAMDGTVSS
jgi:hypothetical protein